MRRYEYTEKEDIKLRLTEIQSILESNLYEDEQEEIDLMSEKSYLEIELDILESEEE
jgi:hypothetical protein